MKHASSTQATRSQDYTDYLAKDSQIWWKRLFHVQAPYAWNLRRLKPGFTLEIGCGIGRQLLYLYGNGVGIDHNAASVQGARKQGLQAFTPEQFQASSFNKPCSFDSLLLAHVAEHMTKGQVIDLLSRYVGLLRSHGKLILITPQELGFQKDPSHVEFMDLLKMREIAETLGFQIVKQYSFPFPRVCGKFFRHNEFVSVGIKK
ncbi:MAG TPA: class I SAM-dependent methyltransferase [Candidatus Omnitrophota bacterium]|nr:class I SAM-dependent methyltransferase [Candidatus Omnitrophota bacterium]